MSVEGERWIIGVTGASGVRYAIRLLEVLLEEEVEPHVVFSDAGLRALNEEEGIAVSHGKLSAKTLLKKSGEIHFYNPRDIGAAIASGSFAARGMVVCPCSMGSLAAIAHGMSQNLLHRAADVTLKERRTLIVVPRETPLTTIHLENMLAVTRAGGIVCPAMPGFYHRPKSVSDIVDLQVMKILDLMGIRVDLAPRWGEPIQKGTAKIKKM